MKVRNYADCCVYTYMNFLSGPFHMDLLAPSISGAIHATLDEAVYLEDVDNIIFIEVDYSE